MDEDKEIEIQSLSLERQAQEILSPDKVKILKKIAYYTSKVGLSLKESCLLLNIDPEHFKKEMDIFPIIGKIIAIKELEYKKDLLMTLSTKAKNGDDKLAQWLLAKKYPEEYGDRRDRKNGDDKDVVFEAIQYIRSKGDSRPLIATETFVKPVVLTKMVKEDHSKLAPIDSIFNSSDFKSKVKTKIIK